MPVLIKRGHRGPYVADIQAFLNLQARFGISAYPRLVEDGAFGKLTKQRVQEWQMFHGLEADGIVGPKTWNAMFHGAMPFTVQAAANGGGENDATPPVQDGYLYLLDGPSFMGERRTGNFPRRSIHSAGRCHYVFVDPGHAQNMGKDMGQVADENNLRVKELIICGHSGGAGVLRIGGLAFYMGGSAVTLFNAVKPRLRSGAIIWIFACSFATPSDQVLDTDHDIIWPWEKKEGKGTRAMREIAQHTGCEVRAGFSYQTKNFEHFSSAWASVKPNGQLAIFSEGREVSFGERVTRVEEGVKAILNKGTHWMGW